METALKIVMPWLCAKDVGVLGRTCKAMAEAARSVTERRVGDASQGWENMAVPIENHVDDCRYPDFQFTPYSRLSGATGLPFGGPWGGGSEMVAERKRGVRESDFGGAMVMGHVLLGPEVGCRCSSDCSTASYCLSDCPSPEYFSEKGGTSTGLQTRIQPHSDSLAPLEEGWKRKKKKCRIEEHSLSPDEAHDRIEDQKSTGERLDDCNKFPSRRSFCLCGRYLGGTLAYDTNSRLRLPDVSRRKRSSPVRVVQEGSRRTEVFEGTPNFKQSSNQSVDESGEAGGGIDDLPLVMECGQACSCSCRCKYRVSQSGLAVRTKVVRTSFKGWGLLSNQDIVQGSFVCEYAGELITTGEARKRQKAYDDKARIHEKKWQGSALLTVREHLPSRKASVRVNVDATKIGNVARFVNHSCDGGNLIPCLIRTAGCLIPKLALFARRAIKNGEELSYSYGTADADAESWKPCFCGTFACIGRLPSERT